MKYLTNARAGVLSGRHNAGLFAFVFAMIAFFLPEAAFAQTLSSGSDPFATATTAAQSVTNTFKTFALAVGAIGMISCLLLGFFGKLNWKWVATGIGVSFAIAIVTPAINWLNSLGG